MSLPTHYIIDYLPFLAFWKVRLDRVGARQMTKKAEIDVSGGLTPTGGNFSVWSATPG